MQTLKLTKKYETYPEYKDSGVEWLGMIPKGWELKKVKHVAEILPSNVDKLIVDGEVSVRLCNYLDVYRNGKITRGMVDSLMVATASKIQIKKLSLLADDVIITKDSETPDDIGIPAHVPETLPGVVCGYHLAIIRPQKIKGAYLAQFLLSQGAKIQFFMSANGLTRYALGIGEIGSTMLFIPHKNIQEKIVKYLDEKTVCIDQIIEKKQREVELLKEKRTSVINTSISSATGEKGKLKNYIQLNPSKKMVSITGPEDTVSFVPMEAISELGELELQERKYRDVSSGFTYFRNGDVVLAKITPCYENGKAGVMKGLKNEFGFGTTEFMVMRPSNKIIADYLYYVVFSDKFRKMGEVEMRGTAGQKRITSSFVMNYELFIPDIKTQEKIVAELSKKMKMFDVVIAKVETSISSLKEFQTSLITNVVTGKIKI